jgi:hypothetical protein
MDVIALVSVIPIGLEMLKEPQTEGVHTGATSRTATGNRMMPYDAQDVA